MDDIKIKGIKNIKKMAPYLKKQRGMIALSIFFRVLNIPINAILPFITSQVLLYFTEFNFERVLFYSLIFLGLYIIGEIIVYIGSRFANRWIRTVSRNLQNDLISHFLDTESANLDKTNSGKMSTRLIGDCDSLSFSLNRIFIYISRGVSGIVYVVIALVVNLYIGLFMFAFSIVTFLLNRIIAHKQAKFAYVKRSKMDVMMGLSNETTRGWRDVKGLGLKNTVENRVADLNYDYSKYSIHASDVVNGLSGVNSVVSAVMKCAFFIICAWFMLENWIDIAVFLVMYTYYSRIVSALNVWGTLQQEVSLAEMSAKRVFEILDERSYPVEKFGTQELDCVGDIKFDDVTFSYDDKKEVLKNLSFEIKPNTLVAFVGESGIGKSTILGLLTRLYTQKSGKIMLDDVDIREINEQSLRKSVGLVLQTPYVFNMSIAENLRLAKPDATDDELKNACKLAELDDFIETLPEKYDSLIGENGVILSGGQRQRLAIARALLKNNKILLFDEATSALDNKSQEKIKKVFENLKNEHTIVIVAHRLSTVLDADNIMLVSDGKIKAQGTHKQLLKSSPEYQALYQNEGTGENKK